jgi:multisubunit Na+/H+ antiporter MnhG subunit
MGKKMLLNTVYTVGIVVCIAILIWGVQNSRYEFVMAAALLAAVFIVLKIKLLKEVRGIINSKK